MYEFTFAFPFKPVVKHDFQLFQVHISRDHIGVFFRANQVLDNKSEIVNNCKYLKTR